MRIAFQCFRKVFLAVLSIIIMLGCDDEPSERLPCVPFTDSPCQLYKVQKEVGTVVTTDEFQFDDLKRPVSHTRSVDSEIRYTSAFEYNIDGLLSKVINQWTWNISYNSDGRISQIDSRHYVYNESGQMITFITHLKGPMCPTCPPEIILRYTDFAYTDATCLNVERMTARSSGEMKEYAYDNKRSVWSMLSLLLNVTPDYSINNVTTEKDHLGEVITYSYEYNAHGYPTKCIRSNESKTINEVYTFFYTCDR